MRVSWFVVVGFIIGAAASCGTAGPTVECTPSNCTGCCSDTGDCLAGDAVDACGGQGAACTSCAANQFCGGGACQQFADGDYDASFPEKAVTTINPDAGIFGFDGGTVVETQDDGGIQQVSYLSQLKPIFDAKCSACHNWTWANLVPAEVTPGDPASSNVYTRTSSGDMPRGGATPLTSTQQRLLRDWILNGAPNN